MKNRFSDFLVFSLLHCIFYRTLNNLLNYRARRLIGSPIIESAAYCNQKLLAHLYLNSTQNTSVNWINRLLAQSDSIKRRALFYIFLRTLFIFLYYLILLGFSFLIYNLMVWISYIWKVLSALPKLVFYGILPRAIQFDIK